MVIGDRLPAPATGIHRTALGKVEIPFRIGLEIKCELVKARSRHHVVVEALVEIGFTVVVQVVQPGDALTPERVDDVIDDAQSERLEKAGCNTPPLDLL